MAVPFSQQLAATYDESVTERNKASNQWHDASFLNHMESVGGVERRSGGTSLKPTVDYRQNPGLDFLATDTTPTSTSKTEVLTMLEYSWVPVVIPVNWTIVDEVLNSEKNARVDLLASLTDNAVSSHDQGFEAALFATTGGTDGFNTLVDIYTEDGTGTVGTCDSSVETWHKNKFKDWGTDTGATLLADYNTLYFDCSKGSSGRQPNVVVANSTLYGSFMAANQAQQRFMTSGKAKAGFDSLFLINAEYIFTNVITSAQDSAWMFNTNDTKVYVVKGAWRQRRSAIEAINSLMMNMKTFSVAQLATRNRSRGGVLFT